MSALDIGPLFLCITAAYILGGVYTMQNPGVDAFTPQEWMWSVRDGYLPEMIAQYVKQGGLASAGTDTIVPFTPQEWRWAIRDEYLGDMISQSIKTGGLEFSPAELDGVVSTPFTLKNGKCPCQMVI